MSRDDAEQTYADPVAPTRPRGYANALHVDFSLAEFTLDFLQSFGDEGATPAQCRLVTSPANMPAFVAAMRVALDDYERRYGALPEPRED